MKTIADVKIVTTFCRNQIMIKTENNISDATFQDIAYEIDIY